MNVLVTGCNGMLGREFYASLRDKGFEVFGIDNNIKAYWPSTWRKGDITNQEEMRQIFEAFKPDIVVHCAAWTDVDACEKDKDKAQKVNIQGTAVLATLAKETNALICYMSTDYVFDGEKAGSYVEHDLPNPINFYAETKFQSEEAVKRSGASYIILRTSWLFGGDSECRNFVNAIIKQYNSGKDLHVVDDQKGRPTYTKDFARAVVRIIEFYKDKKNISEIFHIANDDAISWFEFAKVIIEKIGGDKSRVFPINSQKLDRTARRPKNSVLDTAKYENTFNDKLRSWRFCLDEFINNMCKA